MNIVLENKEHWSAEELKELEDEWKSVGGYEDVKASHIQDCTATVSKCLNGCTLENHRPNHCNNEGWYIKHDEKTCSQKIVYCSKHGYARIYVISKNNYSRST